MENFGERELMCESFSVCIIYCNSVPKTFQRWHWNELGSSWSIHGPSLFLPSIMVYSVYSDVSTELKPELLQDYLFNLSPVL